MENELLNLLAIRYGHFKFESGHHGNLWLDLDLLFLRPGAVRPFALQLATKLRSYHLSAICGPLVGGALLAQMIASELDVEFYYTERLVQAGKVEYRLPTSLRTVVSGKDVAIVDDVINAGSAVRGTFAALRACGANVRVVSSLLVLGSSAPSFFAAEGIALETLGNLQSNLWTPADCPLCKAHIPLVDMALN